MRRLVLPGLVAVLALALVGLLIFGVLQTTDDTSIDQALAQGEHPQAHDAALPSLDGGTHTLADFRGKVVVVNFFAHWCTECAVEAPLIASAQKEIERRGGTFVGVAWDDTTEEARAFARKYGLEYPIVRDVDGSFARAYGVLAMPETFVIDRDGRIAAAAPRRDRRALDRGARRPAARAKGVVRRRLAAVLLSAAVLARGPGRASPPPRPPRARRCTRSSSRSCASSARRRWPSRTARRRTTSARSSAG